MFSSQPWKFPYAIPAHTELLRALAISHYAIIFSFTIHFTFNFSIKA